MLPEVSHPLEAPPEWPPGVRDVYAGLQTYRIVGASVCVDAIMQALGELARTAAERPGGDVYAEVARAGALFCALKPDTAAYANAVRWITGDLPAASGSPTLVADAMAQRIDVYRRQARTRMARITADGADLLAAHGCVLLHDYSSTVLAVLAEAGRRGQHLSALVTAGQPLDQGPRVAVAVASSGHHVTFVPDTAIGRVMPDVDVVLTGVETLYRNGNLANTVGTYPIALVAREAGVPVYGVAECIKIHPTATSASGAGLSARLLHPWPGAAVALPAGTAVRTEVLDLTPAHLITAYVTDAGVLSPERLDMAVPWPEPEDGMGPGATSSQGRAR